MTSRIDVKIDPLNLQAEFIALPAELARANQQYADAVEDFLQAEMVMERTTAQLTMEHRERLLMEAQAVAGIEGKKGVPARAVTVDQVKSAVESDSRWETVKLGYIACEVEKVRSRGTVDALQAKKDALVSLGAMIRAEMSADPTIRKMVSQASAVEWQGIADGRERKGSM